MKYGKYDSDIKKKKFEDLWISYKYYIYEELLNDATAKSLDKPWSQQEFYDELEEVAYCIKCSEGY